MSLRHETLLPPESTAPASDSLLLDVQDLSVSYRIKDSEFSAVAQIGFQLRPGETTALLGESGSGKSTIIGAIAGTLPDTARTTGTVLFGSQPLLGLSESTYRQLRGSEIGYVPQNPARSLDPLQRIAQQLDEALAVHGLREPRDQREERILRMLSRVGFRYPAAVARRYPHELSGGMQQRVLIAIALAWTPKVLIADEPTSALDATVQKSILDLIDRRKAESRMAVLLVTHDIGVAAQRSQHVVVLRHGRIVEAGPSARVLGAPQHEYTRQLLRDAPGATPRTSTRRTQRESTIAIRVSGLSVDYQSRGAAAHRAVNDVSFDVVSGSTMGIVGESGSGKTTTARVIARLTAPSVGQVQILDDTGTSLEHAENRVYRRHVQYVYQNPYQSLNPRHPVRTVLTEPLRALRVGDPATHAARVLELLDMVALPHDVLDRRSRELSGGQLQRLAIARALAAEPSVLVLDEPVSALDVTVQAQILRLLDTLQSRLNLTYVFISHDLTVVRQIADEVVVMKDGQIVECGATERVFEHATHAYTRQLIAAMPDVHSASDPAPAAANELLQLPPIGHASMLHTPLPSLVGALQ